jgi:CRISPR type III-associated protein (TIGR04423 family)
MNMPINGIKKLNNLSEIGANYKGYYWMSDVSNPEPFTGKFPAKPNAFLMEALLTNGQKSIMISHNGQLNIFEYDLDLLKATGAVLEDISFETHRLPEGKAKFKQLWLQEKDAFCEGMEVLTLKAQIFVGFENDKH